MTIKQMKKIGELIQRIEADMIHAYIVSKDEKQFTVKATQLIDKLHDKIRDIIVEENKEQYCTLVYDYSHNGYDTECGNFLYAEANPSKFIQYCQYCGKTIKWGETK